MGRIRLAPAVVAAAVAVATAVLLSGGSRADPRTPPAAPGQPRPFLGTALIGSGGLLGAVDAYGDLVDLRYPGPAGEAQVDNSSRRQAAGTVPADTGLVPAVAVGAHRPLPLWRGTTQRQAYRPATNLLVTGARVGEALVRIEDAAGFPRPQLSRRITVRDEPGRPLLLRIAVNFDLGGDASGDEIQRASAGFSQRDGGRRVRCTATPPPRGISLRGGDDAIARLTWHGRGLIRASLGCSFAGAAAPAGALAAGAAAADRLWIGRARPLGPRAPGWAVRMYRRSLLVLRALGDRRSGATPAGARDRWSYVWPRDAGAAVLALARAGYRNQAERTARFLLGLDLGAGARFRGDGSAVGDGRALPGDSTGWVRAAAIAAGIHRGLPRSGSWRRRGDYGERDADSGDYLANAIAGGATAAQIDRRFATPPGLVRRAGDRGSGLDSAAAWAVRPFPRPALFGEVRRTLEKMVNQAARFGISPAEDWPYREAWTAPTAWSAWSLAALGDRRAALRLMRMLRRAATPAGMLPERADPTNGLPRSTTPLGWSHAFAVLALRELYAQ